MVIMYDTHQQRKTLCIAHYVALHYSDFNADLKSILPLLKQKLSCSVVVELSVCFMMLLAKISGPSDQQWSNVVKETTRGGGGGCHSAHSLQRAGLSCRLPAFMHSQFLL